LGIFDHKRLGNVPEVVGEGKVHRSEKINQRPPIRKRGSSKKKCPTTWTVQKKTPKKTQPSRGMGGMANRAVHNGFFLVGELGKSDFSV